MADENFEDDLFADLYTDEDDGSKAATSAAPAPVVKSEAPVVSSAPEVQAEEPVEDNDEYGGQDQQMYGNDQDGDDDIDFNLGNGSGGGHPHEYDETPHQQRHGPGIKEDGKMFIGGLNWETTDESLKNYFSQFGEVAECTVMRDGASGRSRGFGFLTFKDAKTVNIVMVKEHYLDGKIIDPKRAIPRDEQEKTSKIFVGGVSQEASEQDFKEYFMQFGRVVDATLMMDKDTGRPRGFGFVTFDSEAAVDACLSQPLEIHGKPIEVKKAQPRGNMREEETNMASRGNNRFRKQEENTGNQGMLQNNAMTGAPGGMTPQVMAQYFQRMQQYFVMMQQQMAMGAGRGMGGGMQMNPAMMQQMQQMQAMQQAQMGGNGNNSPGGMAGMNPAMMAQMQQMQQMQAMQGGGGGQGGMGGVQGGGAGGASNPGGNHGSPGYNAYEQQMFEQQKYEQQQQKRAYSQGGGYNNGMGGPTSWEGMYDDVPQPTPTAPRGGGYNRGGSQRGSVPPTGPAPAPPAGAPTGPKNAGKPGANYRGGGRGGGRGGFHPYSRGS